MTKSIILAAAAIAIVAAAFSQNRAEEKEQAVKPAETKTVQSDAEKLADAEKAVDPDAPGVDLEKLDWSKVDWRKRLNRAEFAILRMADTERPFTGEYWDFFQKGAYKCRGCGLPLFESDTKFDAHCGWPSFDKAINDKAVVEIEDNTHGMRRVEVRCRRCGGHLGHVFDDGPTATGLRYCMNSASIKFVPADDKKAPTENAPANPAAPTTPKP